MGVWALWYVWSVCIVIWYAAFNVVINYETTPTISWTIITVTKTPIVPKEIHESLSLMSSINNYHIKDSCIKTSPRYQFQTIFSHHVAKSMLMSLPQYNIYIGTNLPRIQTRNSSGANKPERNYYNCRKWWHSCVDFFNECIFLESQWNQNINNSVVSGTTTKTNDYATWFTFHFFSSKQSFLAFWKIKIAFMNFCKILLTDHPSAHYWCCL